MVELLVYILGAFAALLTGLLAWTDRSLRLETVRREKAEQANEIQKAQILRLVGEARDTTRAMEAVVEMAGNWERDFRAHGYVMVFVGDLGDLQLRAARAEEAGRQAAAHRRALDRIADGHELPAKLAAEAIAAEQKERERAACATN